MFRSSLLAGFIGIAVLGLQAQQVVQSRGVPASVTSPTPGANGIVVYHGIPASVLSPTPRPALVNPVPRGNRRPGIQVSGGPRAGFGNPGHRQIIPVPVFYPVYGYGVYSDYDVPPPADHYVSDLTAPPPAGDTSDSASGTDTQALQRAYYQGAHDALAQQEQQERYGQHYLDSREPRSAPAPASPSTADAAKPAPSGQPGKTDSQDDSTPTVFIFKDGHRVETSSYAIMGAVLYDFSSRPLKKIQLTDLDKVATTKANDDRGISVSLP